MPWHPIERAALVTALTDVGPGAPTLCEGWRSEHLATHVVLRERAPLLAAGNAVPPLAGRTGRVTIDRGDAAASPAGFARLVDTVRAGPPRWSPVGWLGDAGNLLELFVHTEDVRRGGPDGADVPVRYRAPEHDDALWRRLRQIARLLYKGSPVGVVLADPGGRSVRAARPRSGPDGGPAGEVVVRGPIDELVLHAFNRTGVARVTMDGLDDAVAALGRHRAR